KGPFITNNQNDSLLTLQIFLCVIAITMMFLSTTLAERRETETKLKNVNSSLEKARQELEDSMKVKENFLANMSHEIRTPMNAIVGFTELLEKTTINSEQEQYINAVKTSGENLLVIINDILDFSKIQSGKIIFEQTGMKLSALMNRVRVLMFQKANEKNINLEIHIDENVPDDLLGDPTRISQILINLVDNAIKFTEKGEVKINVHLLSDDGKIVTLQFEVQDTGIGIPEDKLSSVFEGFTQASNETTRKYGGTGLGLAIVKQLVELQYGSIAVKSKSGIGSVFSVNLPFMKNQKPVPQKINVPENEILNGMDGMNILLVEDNELNQLLVQKILDIFEHQLVIVANGREALWQLEENNFDLVLLDLQLPEMDGYEVARYIRTQLPPSKSGIPIIAVTAHAMPGEAEKCYDAGMNAYLSKPFTKSALIEKIVYVMKTPGENHKGKME
ncbi:MAG TPA: ATP-binding protein, partial [Bacteroidia bacterium]|nr:ATP-binding protein [Bacteroidia bacterium]